MLSMLKALTTEINCGDWRRTGLESGDSVCTVLLLLGDVCNYKKFDNCMEQKSFYTHLLLLYILTSFFIYDGVRTKECTILSQRLDNRLLGLSLHESSSVPLIYTVGLLWTRIGCISYD